MGQYTINLSTDQDNAINDMLPSGTTLEDYIKSIADSHIKQQLDKQWADKTDEEKQTLLDQ